MIAGLGRASSLSCLQFGALWVCSDVGKELSNSDVELIIADNAAERVLPLAAVGVHCFNKTT